MNNFEQRLPEVPSQNSLNIAARLRGKKAIAFTGAAMPEQQLPQPEANLPWAARAALIIDPDVTTIEEARRFDREAFTFSGRILNLGTTLIETGLVQQGIDLSLDAAMNIAGHSYETYVEGPVRKFGRFAMNLLRKAGNAIETGIKKFNDAGERVAEPFISLLSVAVDGLTNNTKGRHRRTTVNSYKAIYIEQAVTGVDALDLMLH